jgi:CheY-like chemotaxis protein
MKLEGKKLLLVEDDNFIGDMFIRKLQAEGAICSRAVNGKDGLVKLKKSQFDFDIIITDVMMTNMDGYEMVRTINKIDEAKNIPIVVLTNRNSLNSENSKIAELNIAGFFIKSGTDLSVLIDELTKIIQKPNNQPIVGANQTTPPPDSQRTT